MHTALIMHAKEQAIVFNNVGVEFFINSRLEDAAIMFDGTIQLLANTIDLAFDPEASVSTEKAALALLLAYRNSAPHLPETRSLSSCSRKISLLNRVRSQPDPNILASMFSNAFRVMTSEETDPVFRTNELRFIAAIAMYNGALCHHLSATTGALQADQVHRYMHTAAMLYTLAYQVAIPLVDIMGHLPAFGRLLMVSLNNFSVLLHEVGEYDNAKQYLDILNKVMLHFNEDVDDEEFAMQRANFMLNTILLKEPTTAASA
jgi:hypothetical protein